MAITTPILLNIPEIINTDRLTLRVQRAGDGIALHKAMVDGYEDCVKWLSWSEERPTPEMVELECRKHHAAFILREDMRYLIINRNTNEVMGRCAFPPTTVNWSVPRFGIAYFLAKRFRGSGYATETAHILTRLAFKYMQARRVEIRVDPENKASLKIAEHLGFVLEAKQKGIWVREDKEELADLWTYVLFDIANLPELKIYDNES